VPRHHRRRPEQPRGGGGAASSERRETFRGETYLVRAVAGAAAGKSYRCPGCDQLIATGVPHVVAWPEHDAEATDRRHWHTPCWAARGRRAPGIQRSRNAPRF
jgi:hypothetical protein